ncbi:MAG TPA: hypothetical protein VLF60_04900 [Candidatus Saccharimonadales bacterium]|nr:hypothetical protein [Candidatus Saccharimonadales bacterium]
MPIPETQTEPPKEKGAEAEEATDTRSFIGRHAVSSEALPDLAAEDTTGIRETSEYDAIPLHAVLEPVEVEQQPKVAGESPKRILDETSEAGAIEEDVATDAQREPRKISTTWWEGRRPSKPVPRPIIQSMTSGEKAIPAQLDKHSRTAETDYSTTWEAPHQEDSGLGATAMAVVCHDRIAKLQAEGKITEEEEIVVCEVSDYGAGMMDFMAKLREKDQQNETEGKKTVIASRFKGIIMCSPERAELLRKSGAWENEPQVEIREVDLTNPKEITLPPNTMVAMLDGTTNHQLESYQLVQLKDRQGRPSGDVLDLKTITAVQGTEPLITVDTKTGQINAVQPGNWYRKSHQTAEGNPAEFTPQLIGRAVVSASFRQSEVPFEDTGLVRKDRSARNFAEDEERRPARLYNYTHGLEALIARMTEGVGPDGMVLVGGHMRFDPDVPIPNLVRQDTVEIPADPPTPKNPNPAPSYILASPLRLSVTEAGQIEDGVRIAAKTLNSKINTHTEGQGRGNTYDYMIIDRADDDEAEKALAVFKEGIAPQGKSRDEILAQAETALINMKDGVNSKDTINLIAKRVREANNPLLERDYELHLGLSKLFREYELPHQAAAHAAKATELLPIASGAHLEMAEAALAADELKPAIKAAERARELSPNNAKVYELGIRLAQKQEDLDAEIANRLEHLRCVAGESPVQTMEKLYELCDALTRDYAAHREDSSHFKTILIEDLETGKYTPHRIVTSQIKQIRTTDTILEARDVVQRYFNDNPNMSGEEMDEFAERFNALWEAACPRSPETGEPLAREAWPDRPQGMQRWIYEGLITQSDKEAVPKKLVALNLSATTDTTKEVALPKGRGKRIVPNLIKIGDVQRINGTEGPFTLSQRILLSNVFVVGLTGKGKTTLAEGMATQIADMDASLNLFDLGDKPGMQEMVEALNARGIPVSHFRINDPNSSPVCLDLFEPIPGCSVTQHIGSIVTAWKAAYEMPDPFPQALKQALEDIYAANGWDLLTDAQKEGLEATYERPPHATTPTLEQLRVALMARTEHYVKTGGPAAAIQGFFKTRAADMKTEENVYFLTEGAPIDMVKIVSGGVNVWFDFSAVVDKDQRRFFANLFFARKNLALEHCRGISYDNTLKSVDIVDEAGLILDCPPGSSDSRQKGVEELVARMRTNRQYGNPIVWFTQGVSSAHEDARTQVSTTISFGLTSPTDAEIISKSLRVEVHTPLGLPIGESYVASGGAKGVRITIHRPRKPSEAALEAARRNPVPLPLKSGASAHSLNERKAAARQAREDSTVGIRNLVRNTALGHIAGIPLPAQIPEETRELWKRTNAESREKALLLAETIVSYTLQGRREVVARHYDPNTLAKSVLRTAVGMLDETEPMSQGRHASSAFIVPEVAWALAWAEMEQPDNRRPAEPYDFARPAPLGIGQAAITANQRVRERRAALQRHPLSPERDPKTAELAAQAILGYHDGIPMWRDIRTGAEGEQIGHPLGLRRVIAAQQGYLPSVKYPGFSPIEGLWGLPKLLLDQTKERQDREKQELSAK